MRITKLFLYITCLVPASLYCSTPEKADASVLAVLAADQARAAALLAGDTAALDKLLADDLCYTHSNGKIETKAIHLATLTAGLRYEKFVTSAIRGQVVTRDVVVLFGKIDQRKNNSGQVSSGVLMFHAVWRNDPMGWRLVSMQTAAMPPK